MDLKKSPLALSSAAKAGALALVFSLIIHLILLGPTARWISASLFPKFNEQTIDLEIFEARPPKKKEREKFRPLPKDKKNLTQDEDRPGKNGGKKQKASTQTKKGPWGESPAMKQAITSTSEGKGVVEGPDSKLNFTMNTWKWSWKRYMENWAIDLGRWWQPPDDYMAGQYPDGGYVWIKVKLSKSGELLGYEVMEHNVSSTMKLMAVQALLAARLRPSLPENFPKDHLEVSWKFIYPPFAVLQQQLQEMQQRQK
ncbi:MAG: hypothetical protein QNL04_10755 [SAR324 cluster bacterium]|nr:hypothetical protein [SAR324 cluster bacterium]